MENLTDKQKQIFLFILEHINEKGYPPTVIEIAGHMGFASPNAAKKSLDILERKKYIRRSSGRSRAIEIIKNTSVTSQIRMVPIIGRIAAGTPILAVENIEDSVALDKNLAKCEDSFLLRVQGESMIEAHIENNDLVLIKPQSTVENGEIAAVIIDNEATVKRFKKTKDAVLLEPANSSMKPIEIKNGDFRIIGKVVGVIRQI